MWAIKQKTQKSYFAFLRQIQKDTINNFCDVGIGFESVILKGKRVTKNCQVPSQFTRTPYLIMISAQLNNSISIWNQFISVKSYKNK